MAKGGFRKGSGRKAGSTNRFSKALLERVQEEGIMPVDYLLSVMRNETEDTRVRIDAAKAAAPYVHHKLSAVTVDLSAPEQSHEEWLMSLR